MEAKTASYLRERRRLSGEFSIARDAVSGVLGAIAGLIVPNNPTKLQSFAYAAAGALITVVVVEIVAFAWRFVWVAPKRMHFDMLGMISEIERERDVIKSRLTEHDSHQQIADMLTDEHDYAIRTFMHRQFDAEANTDSENVLKQWERDVAEWETRLYKRMEELECTKQELHGVKTFGGWPFIQFHRFHHWKQREKPSEISFRPLGRSCYRSRQKSRRSAA